MPDPIAWSVTGHWFALALLAGYVLGSVPFGLVITRAAGLGDIRQIGSGNIGATNVLRTGRKDLALATLLLDGGKGAAAVLIGWIWGPYIAMFAGIGAFLGHLYPVWLKFRGGKGVATTLGLLIAYAWPVGLSACAVWLVTAALFRFSSLASLMAVLAAPLAAFAFEVWTPGLPMRAPALLDSPALVLTGFIAVVVWWKHRANIRRLVKGEEPRLGRKAKAPTA